MKKAGKTPALKPVHDEMDRIRFLDRHLLTILLF